MLSLEFFQEEIKAYYMHHEDGLNSIFITWSVEGHLVRFAQLMQLNELAAGMVARFENEAVIGIRALLASLFTSDVAKHMSLVYIWTDIGNNWMPSYQNMAVERWEAKQLEHFSKDTKSFGTRHEMDMMAWFMGAVTEAEIDEAIGDIPIKATPTVDPAPTVDPLDLPPTEPDRWDNALGDSEDE